MISLVPSFLGWEADNALRQSLRLHLPVQFQGTCGFLTVQYGSKFSPPRQ
jgi:hypothetical protein